MAERLLWKLFAVDGESLCFVMFFLQTLYNGDPEPNLSALSSVDKPRRKIGNGKLESSVFSSGGAGRVDILKISVTTIEFS